MAHTIKLGTFKKHEESTKQPNTASWDSYSVVFKDGTDIVNPTITISAGLSTVKDYNYGYMMGRYYWIRGMNAYRSGYIILDLECDVLATYKSEIGDTNLYILRSASNSDGTIIDNYYPTKASVSYTQEIDDFFYNTSPYSNGYYVVNVAGIASAGTSTLWKLTPSEFRSFISNLYTTIDGYQPADVLSAVSKLVGGQPEKLVSSAMWFPNSVSFTVGSPERIYVGTWDSGVEGKLITNPIFVKSDIWMDINKHPQAASRGSFLNLAPYSTYTLTLPLFGAINLDTTAILDATQIQIYIRVDALSGIATAEISGGGSRPELAYLTAQLGVALPLVGQSSGSSVAGGVISTLANVAAAIVSGGASTPIIGAVSSGIGTAVSAVTGASFSTGSGGNILSPSAPIILNSTHLTLVDEDNTRNGRPYCKVKKPSTLSGFMIAQRGDVDIPGTIPEQRKIKMYLESGFFYE